MGFSLPESGFLVAELGFLSVIEIGVRDLVVGFWVEAVVAKPLRSLSRRADEADMDLRERER